MNERPGEVVAIATEIGLGESPRVHGGRVWFCDWLDGTVLSIDPDGGNRIEHARVDGFPVSIDWDVADRLLIVDGAGRRLLGEGPEGCEVVADLTKISAAPWNEIAAHPSGRVYVNGVGFDMMAGESPSAGQIAVVDVDGSVHRVAHDLAFPNGMAILGDGAELVVAESHAGRITSYAITDDGDLTDRATIAAIPGSAPDGVCAAPDGTIWYADVPNRHCQRLSSEGQILQTVEVDRACFSCALSPDGTLYITAAVWDERTFTSRRGVLYRAEVAPHRA